MNEATGKAKVLRRENGKNIFLLNIQAFSLREPICLDKLRWLKNGEGFNIISNIMLKESSRKKRKDIFSRQKYIIEVLLEYS